MRSGYEYTHPRFMDVTFIARKVFRAPNRFKIKAEWLTRGRSNGVITRHEIMFDKAREFRRMA